MAENQNQSLYTQLAKAQAEFIAPKRTKEVTGTFRFTYAPLEECLDAVRPALAKHGLFLTQGLERIGETEYIRTAVYYGDLCVENHWPLINTQAGAQKHGGAATFARRYGLCSLLGLAPEDDDDANSVDNTGNVTTDRRPPPQASNGNGKPKTGPLPKSPQQAVYDPETGETGPRAIPVRLAGSKPDWIAWGGQLVAVMQKAATLEEGEAWVTANKDALTNAESDVPKIYERIAANIKAMRAKFQPDFMAAQ